MMLYICSYVLYLYSYVDPEDSMQVIIFDKDGTLVCFHTMWTSWCEELANRFGLVFHQNVGFDHEDLW